MKREKFSDRIRRQLRNKNKVSKKKSVENKEIEFSCLNCLNLFKFEYTEVCLDETQDLKFIPEPTCPQCSSTEDLMFTDYSQEQIEDMIFRNQIKKCN